MSAITLTEKLEEKASKKLQADINALRKFLNSDPIAAKIRFTVKSGDRTNTDTLCRLVNFSEREIEEVIEKMLPEYIERETSEFIEKVDRLTSEIEDLQNSINY